MSDMRLVVVGAGGRMGRTLVKAIAEIKDLTIAGAVEQAGSTLQGQDSGVLAGIGANGILVGTDLQPLLASADGVVDFTTPQATVAHAELVAANGLVHIIGATGHTSAHVATIAAASR